jgi:hypothetical protein
MTPTGVAVFSSLDIAIRRLAEASTTSSWSEFDRKKGSAATRLSIWPDC